MCRKNTASHSPHDPLDDRALVSAVVTAALDDGAPEAEETARQTVNRLCARYLVEEKGRGGRARP